MKIGIVTIPFHSNYGGILQAWALQQALSQLGHKPILLRRPGFQAAWTLQPIAILRRGVLRLRGKHVPLLARIHDMFLEREIAKFVRSHIEQSPELSNAEKLADYVRTAKLDAVVAGSDQIWRPGIAEADMFLGFLDAVPNARRIAYAASFGADAVDFGADLERYANLSRRFDAVSVREDSAVETCRTLFGVSASPVLDPTLLVDPEKYESIAEMQEGNFLATYFLAGKNFFLEGFEKKLHLSNCPEHNLPTAADRVDALLPPPLPSVETWLGTLAGARCVATDSFHGVAFSILFNKPFVAFDNGSGIGRIRSLLRFLGMENRIISNEFSESRIVRLLDCAPCNEETSERLSNGKERSFSFLRTALQ